MLKEAVVGENEDQEGAVIIFYEGAERKSLAYEDAFLLDADLIVELSFLQKWIRQVGPYHQGLLAGRELEMACRLLEGGASCTLLPAQRPAENTVSDEDELTIHKENLAMAYAYMIRRHMDQLHARTCMDSVFMGVCRLMQEKGILQEFQLYMNMFLSDNASYEQMASFTAPFLVLRGDNTCGGVLRQFADDLSESLAENDQAVIEYGGEENDQSKNLLKDAENKVFKGIVGFQAAALEIPYFQKLHGPKFQFWFDNPFSFPNVLRNLPEDNYVLCQDQDHADWIREYYHSNALQFPPGGMEVPYVNDDRSVDIVFIGRFFEDRCMELTEIQKAFYDHMLLHPSSSFEQGVLEMHDERFFSDEDMKDLPGLLYKLKPACRAVVGYFRNLVVETILQSGILLHVYGEEWKEFEGRGKENLLIHPEIPMKDSMKIFQKAKIGLNVMSWYKAGMTERIANIMLSGAVCISDETRYLRENIRDGEEIVLYRLTELEKLPEQIKCLLRNEPKRAQIAEKAYLKAKKELGWNNRARQLIDLSNRHFME